MGMYERQLLGYDGRLLSISGKILRLFAAGLYTFEEVNTMIGTQGYVPVSTAADLLNIRETGSRIMGAGSPWEGTYTTGMDKKYIQVNVIDLGGPDIEYTPPEADLSGIYDGNELMIKNLYTNETINKRTGLLGFLDVDGIGKNIRVEADITCFLAGGIVAQINYGVLENCMAYGSIKNTTGQNAQVGGITGSNIGTVKDCINYATVTSTLSATAFAGGIVAQKHTTGGTSLVDNCKNFGNISAGRYTAGIFGKSDTAVTISGCQNFGSVTGEVYVGGIAGRVVSSNVSFCTNSGSIIGTQHAGGIAGQISTTCTISKCKNTGAIATTASIGVAGGVCASVGPTATCTDSYNSGSVSGTNDVGGVVGWMFNGSAVTINCYSVGVITSAGARKGGAVGYLQVGTVTNTYYDSQTSGMSDTGKGNPRTTAQMKEGTASSFILPAGGTDPDSLAANAMYTSWDDVDTWEFGTTSDYPTLK